MVTVKMVTLSRYDVVHGEDGHTLPEASSPDTDEHRLQVNMLPLRCHANQATIEFAQRFFRADAPEPRAGEDATATDEAATASPASHVPTTTSSTSREDAELANGVAIEGKEGPPSHVMCFQSVDVRGFRLKIDYDTRNVDLAALKQGSLIELLNLFPLEGVELELQRAVFNGIVGVDTAAQLVAESWLQDITSSQLHKFVAGTGPIRPLSEVGAGAANLVLLPIQQYKQDGRVLHGLRKGAVGFVKTVTLETVHTSQKVTRCVASVLDDLVSSEDTAPRRLEETQVYEQPANIRAGLKHAKHSLSRGVNSAAHAIIAVPVKEYRRSGPKGALTSVIRAVPVAVLQPVIGATEALSYTLLGFRNGMAPDIKRDEEDKFR